MGCAVVHPSLDCECVGGEELPLALGLPLEIAPNTSHCITSNIKQHSN